MRTKGRHGREMEERFCFLAASYEATSEIYQFGLRTESQDQYSLGKPSHGVYLFKHVDVALRHATASTCSGKNLIVFKVSLSPRTCKRWLWFCLAFLNCYKLNDPFNNVCMFILKVLFGKVKTVTPSLEWERIVDPMVGFDCHMAKDVVSYRDSPSQQVLGSWVRFNNDTK